ncbi:MAG: preprotein translocase subunit YajC [Clostridia bacterium]|nr:preprotein translocase subunit YajC [Clostridia bacterium]
MNLFMLLDTTTAAGEGNTLGSMLTMFLPLILVCVVMYFFMIRPQKKQERQEAQMRDSLQVGDEVTTIGGIIGRVVSIKDETFTLETSRDRTKMRFLRSAIKSVDVKVADRYAEAEAAKAEEAKAEEAAEAPAEVVEEPKKAKKSKKNKDVE